MGKASQGPVLFGVPELFLLRLGGVLLVDELIP